jgi:hypothetical protein
MIKIRIAQPATSGPPQIRVSKLGAQGRPGDQGPAGPTGPSGSAEDPGDLTLLFDNQLI